MATHRLAVAVAFVVGASLMLTEDDFPHRPLFVLVSAAVFIAVVVVYERVSKRKRS